MTRREKFFPRYGGHDSAVLSSIARVGAAGRSGAPFRVAQERVRHREFMTRVRNEV